MTVTAHPRPPLGTGRLIGESFSILFGNFLVFFGIAFAIGLIGLALNALIAGVGVTFGQVAPDQAPDPVPVLFGVLVQIVVLSVSTALIVQLAYEAKIGRPVRAGSALSNALSKLAPIVVLSMAAGLLSGLGAILLIVPGLYLFAMFSVIVPAIVVERVGFGAMARSIELTKEYRWPVLGTLLLVMIIAGVINFVLSLLAVQVYLALGAAAGLLVQAAVAAAPGALFSITTALIYARLREIKEGIGVRSIADVFE